MNLLLINIILSKCGVTSRSIEERFKPIAYRYYNKTVLLDLEIECKDAVEIEAAIMFKFYKDRYWLCKKDAFKGCTELFKLEQKENILHDIGKLSKGLNIGDSVNEYNFYAGSPRR